MKVARKTCGCTSPAQLLRSSDDAGPAGTTRTNTVLRGCKRRHKATTDSSSGAGLPSLYSSGSTRKPCLCPALSFRSCDMPPWGDALTSDWGEPTRGHRAWTRGAMGSEQVSGQAPPCQVPASWLHPRGHDLAPLRRTQVQQQQARVYSTLPLCIPQE